MSRILIYVLRRDLRVSDNPIFHSLCNSSEKSAHQFTHLLPVYILPAQQVETSGFLRSADDTSPYPEARSAVAKFWRCGPHRAKFLSESIWDLKTSLEKIGSGLSIRIGLLGGVLAHILEEYRRHPSNGKVCAIWMTGEEGVEEKREERSIQRVAENYGKDFKLWTDEKYFVDDRDIPFDDIQKLPDVFTTYRKAIEPLREAPRRTLPTPHRLPPMPDYTPTQPEVFKIPETREEFVKRMVTPVQGNELKKPPQWPSSARSAHPFPGGERAAHQRVQHYLKSGSTTTYKDTRNGMLGEDFSTKFSAWLALGCISARQIHEYLINFENGLTPLGRESRGYGKGENKGTGWIRFELLWRDYFRLCTRKFQSRLFHIAGFRNRTSLKWKSSTTGPETKEYIGRFLEGRTGIGLIDASQRELFLTGYTSNRARQNVASFLSGHLGIDWRIGAEWYESCLIDYDVSSNWGNWQYVAGVGNDPRESRLFNPVKQAFDYDPDGSYVKSWVEELKLLEKPEWIFQPSLVPGELRDRYGLEDLETVEHPLRKIEYRAKSRAQNRNNSKEQAGGRLAGKRQPKPVKKPSPET